jgi:hypothetical protein
MTKRPDGVGPQLAQMTQMERRISRLESRIEAVNQWAGLLQVSGSMLRNGGLSELPPIPDGSLTRRTNIFNIQ